jgi:hypothetical protein
MSDVNPKPNNGRLLLNPEKPVTSSSRQMERTSLQPFPPHNMKDVMLYT